ncbi:MAG: MgtC/SapB family protein [Gammaproteobacteria bacterium]
MEFYYLIPRLLTQFLMTTAFAFVVGLEFRRYQQLNQYIHHFGSTRTFVLVGILGFILFTIDSSRLLYLGGFLLLGSLLSIYYWRLAAEGLFSLFSILIALLVYLIGPVSLSFPGWFLVLFVVVLVLILGEKPLIHKISDRLDNEEMITLAKFLIISGVILPLLPDQAIAPMLPVTYYKVWLAVIIVSGFSYLSYLINTYFFKSRSLLITGILGGLYSSTAATVVIGRRSRGMADANRYVSSALIMATMMMYIRLLIIIFLFDRTAGVQLLVPFLAIIIMSFMASFVLLHINNHNAPLHSAAATKHPLELSTAIVFALLFVIFAWVTHTVTNRFGSHGLNYLAVVVGFTDIDPFILSLLSGKFVVSEAAIVSAVILASGSNNLLKASYAIALARNRSVLFAASWLIFLFIISIVYALNGVP